MRRISFTAICILLLFPAGSRTEVYPYEVISNDHWALEAIQYLGENGFDSHVYQAIQSDDSAIARFDIASSIPRMYDQYIYSLVENEINFRIDISAVLTMLIEEFKPDIETLETGSSIYEFRIGLLMDDRSRMILDSMRRTGEETEKGKEGITRYDMAILLHDLFLPFKGSVEGSDNSPDNPSPFQELPVGHWSYTALAWLQDERLIQGYPDGTFDGSRSFTRYEMAMNVDRILERDVEGYKPIEPIDDATLLTIFPIETTAILRLLLIEFDDIRTTYNIRIDCY